MASAPRPPAPPLSARRGTAPPRGPAWSGGGRRLAAPPRSAEGGGGPRTAAPPAGAGGGGARAVRLPRCSGGDPHPVRASAGCQALLTAGACCRRCSARGGKEKNKTNKTSPSKTRVHLGLHPCRGGGRLSSSPGTVRRTRRSAVAKLGHSWALVLSVPPNFSSRTTVWPRVSDSKTERNGGPGRGEDRRSLKCGGAGRPLSCSAPVPRTPARTPRRRESWASAASPAS